MLVSNIVFSMRIRVLYSYFNYSALYLLMVVGAEILLVNVHCEFSLL